MLIHTAEEKATTRKLAVVMATQIITLTLEKSTKTGNFNDNKNE